MKIRSKRLHLQLILGLFLACILLNGCMQRRLTICSNPPGAVVKIDDVEIGVTPVSTSFIYYGTRKIQLTKPGYETLTILQPVRTPWYQWPGIDFVSEHFVPGKIHDDRLFSYNLQPAQVIPTDQLLRRAEQLRQQAEPLESAGPQVEPLPFPVGPSSQQAPPDSEIFPQDGRLPF